MGSVLFTAIGSWGDLFPFVGVGVELQREGHHVRIAASPAWSEIVEEAGLEFVPIGRHIGFEEFRAHPEIFGRMPFGLRAALGRFVFDQIDEMTSDLTEAMAGVDLLVTHPAQIAAHNVAEHLGVRRLVATVFPSMIPSAHTVPGGTPIGPWSGTVGQVMNRTVWAHANVVAAVVFDRPINRHRKTLGLRPIRGGTIRLPLRADATIVMASPAVIDPPPDWPAQITVTSFVGWDRASTRPVTPQTEAFLDGGDAPVLVTLGASSVADARADGFFEHVATELVDAGARALVITGPGAPPNALDSRMVHVASFEPFSAVAPRCRAAVHHAGIGTTIAIMRAGIPQLAVPRGFDQPVTAALIERLGIGIALPWRSRQRLLRRELTRLLHDAEIQTAATKLSQRIENDGAATTAAAIVRHLVDSPNAPR